jgi:hypothetical protein
MRRKVARTIRTVLSDEQVEVLAETHQTFMDGLNALRVAMRQRL